MYIRSFEGLTYDDVLLVPKFSYIKSRREVVGARNIDISTTFCGFKVKIPIISSPMDTVSGFDMVNKMSSLGALGAFHRVNTVVEQADWVDNLPTDYIKIAAVGSKDSDRARVDKLVSNGVDVLIIDIAHGDSLNCINMLKYIKSNYPQHNVIAGSIATYDGARHMIDWGADGIRCGIGNSGICSTRLVSGFGVPSLTSVMDCATAIRVSKTDTTLIADGGIRSSGDIVKALASGADMVMLGGLLAGTDESPGEIIRGYTKNMLGVTDTYKVYRGMASEEVHDSLNGDDVDYTPEGIVSKVPYKGPVSGVISKLVGGIRSGLSYGGAYNLEELRLNAEFIRITNSGLVESGTYGGEK
jgi:IMP dehydrogenase